MKKLFHAGLILAVCGLTGILWWQQPGRNRSAPVGGAPARPAPTAASEVPAPRKTPPAPPAAGDLADKPGGPARIFGAGGPVTLADVPAGRFRDELVRLAGPARQRALEQLGRLRVPLNDVGSLTVDDAGALFYECAPPDALAVLAEAGEGPAVTSGASVPIASPPLRHSRPGSPKVIYLDFSGHTITGTAWNNAKGAPGDAGYRPPVAAYVAKPFDNDGDPTTFSADEQLYIEQVWKRVAEDYAGFDVDVTTEEPAVFTATTGRAVITTSVDANGVSMPSPSAGGVAYLDVFGSASYVLTFSPALIYTNNLLGYESYVAEAVSHEMGHNLSLSHDGTPTSEYYRGHGSGATSWAPIMGSGYYSNVSQWSKGEYYDANNPQDDLAIIAGHLDYAGDDHADGAGAASALPVAGAGFSGQGIIGEPGDADWFVLTVPLRAMRIQVIPFRSSNYTAGGNLDVRLELYDAADNLIAQDTPASVSTTSAVLETGVAAGTYHLRVTGTGVGQPLANPPSGYTAYGSLGQYTITGTLGTPVAPTISNQPTSQAAQAGQNIAFYVYTGSGNPSPEYRWQRLPAGGSVWADLADNPDFTNTGGYNLGLPAVALGMNGDQFRCRVFNIAGEVISQAVLLTVSPAVPPQIYNMPAFRPVEYGENLTISPSFSGTTPMTYVWMKDGVVVAGATSYAFSKSGVTTADSGVYTLSATNLGGTATSSGTTVAVNPPVAPVIYNVPQTVIQSYGGSLSFSPSVTGTRPITYEWRKDGVTISGATSASYYRGNLTPADSGLYTLTASNAWGATTSPAISVSVGAATAPMIFGLPAGQVVAYGSYISLSPSVTGSAPISYQWSKDGQPIAGATSSSYYVNAATPADSGVYALTASNAQGTVTSAGVLVTVDNPVPPSVYGLPASISLNYGDHFSIYGSVNGTSPLTYVWSKDGVVIAGATSSYYSKSSVTLADIGSYTLTVSNIAGSITSAGVPVTVRPASAPVIYGLPATVVVAHGQSLNLYPSVLGTAPVTYQWQKNGVNVPGATSSSFYKSGVTAADAGSYRLIATNAVGSATSSVVTVLVDAAMPPAIYGLPDSMAVAYGSSLYLSASVTGTQPMTFQWLKDNVALSGQNSSSLSKYDLTVTDAGSYTLVATNAWGATTSQAVVVFVNPAVAPAINNLPPSVTVAYGNSWSVSPSVTGTAPMTYVWKKDGVVIAGATSSYYSKSNATATDSGSYTLTATNLVGSVTSSATTVTVLVATLPSIGNLGGPVVVNYGDSFSFYPSVTGTAPITYQWKKDGVAILQATNYSYSKSAVTGADSGSYTLTATNLVGSVTSAGVSVTVNPPVPPAVFGLPAAVAVNYGDYFSLYPSVTGTSPRTYRWQKDGVDLPNGTNSGFSKSGVTGADSGVYTLIVTNAFGTATSSPVTLVVNAAMPPGIYNLNPAQTIEYGSSLSLYPTVTGTGPITYQWHKDGVAITGATSSYFNKSYATTADNGQYTLTATNLAGTTTSPTVTVTVRPAIPPTVTIQPQPVVAAPERAAYFAVQGAGTSPLAYQWYRDGQALAGATASGLTVANLKTTDFGVYHAVISNPGGSVASAEVALTPDSGLAVEAVAAGSDRSFWIRSDRTLWATGSNYNGELGDGTKWGYSNARQIATGVAAVSPSGTHTLFLKLDGTLWAMGSNDAGQFGNGVTTGSVLPLLIASNVTAMAAGYNVSYFIKTDGALWAMGNNDSGQLGDGTTLSRLTPVQVATAVTAVAAGSGHALFIKTDATLWAMGSNYGGQLGDGTTTARPAPVQVASQVVAVAAGGNQYSVFLKQDGTLWATGNNYSGQLGIGTSVQQFVPVQVALHVAAVAAGYGHTLFVTTDHELWGMGQNAYGQLGDGTTTSRLSPVEIATDVDNISAGSYHSLFTKTDGTLWGMGGNSYGQLGDGTSASTAGYLPEQLTWSADVAPVIRTQPLSQSIEIGADVSFYVSAYGAYPRTYRWERMPAGGAWGGLVDGAGYAGTTDTTLTLTGTTQSMSGDQYRCVVTNSFGSSTSDAATLTLTVPLPVITGQPVGQTVPTGTPVTLSVTASSPVPMTYQWRKDGVDITGATASTHSIASFSVADTGAYVVMVTNSAGAVTSDAAALALALPPVITVDPAAQTVYAGMPASFTVAVTSNAPLSYVWRKNGTPISGATAATYTIASVQAADAADYSVVVSNVAGAVTSGNATLAVNPAIAPVITEQPQHRIVAQSAPTAFTVAATGAPAPSYLWQRLPAGSGTWADVAPGNAAYGGATTPTLLIKAATILGNGGDQYRCVVSNVAGTATSNAATLTVAVGVAPLAAYGGYAQSFFTRIDGTLWAMGANYVGQLVDGTNTARPTPGQVATGVVDVGNGFEHVLFIKHDGTLWAGGDNQIGELGLGDTAGRTQAAPVAANVSAAAAGYRHSLFRKNDGTLWAAGWNANGQLGDGTSVNRSSPVPVATHVKAIAAGYQHSLFIKTDGTLWGMGDNAGGVFGDGTTTSATSPVQLATGVEAVSTFYHTLLLKTDGTLWATGSNAHGQLGDGTTTARATRFQVAAGVTAIGAGAFHSVFLKSDGTLWAMGRNLEGQLGDGTTTDRPAPGQIASNVVSVSAGLLQTFFVKADGTLWATGANDQGQLGDGTTTNRSTPVQIAAGAGGLPRATTSPTATNSPAADRITLTWPLVLGATHYEVWRSATNDIAAAAPLATRVIGSFYEDLTAAPGLPCYYWIKPVNRDGSPGFGQASTGRFGSASVPPAITTPPAGQTVNVGANVTFTVVVGGTAPFTYQWRKGGVDINAATGSSYTITGVTLADAGSYDVVVSNAEGTATSAAATLTVNQLAQAITFAALADRPYTAVPFTLSATASSGLPVVFSIEAGPATLAGSDVTMTGAGLVTVRATQSGDSTYAAAAPVDRSFTVTAAGFASWQTGKFTAGERADPAISGPDADPDHDGFANLLEYALGLEPQAASTTGLPEVGTLGSDWVYTYSRPSDRTDVTYEVEVSTDLVNWTIIGVTHEMVSSAGGMETWQTKHPLSSAANVFFRLKVTQ